jgi:hypothetical protein
MGFGRNDNDRLTCPHTIREEIDDGPLQRGFRSIEVHVVPVHEGRRRTRAALAVRQRLRQLSIDLGHVHHCMEWQTAITAPGLYATLNRV